MDADGSNQTRLTRNNETDSATSWSPDGSQIAFASNRDNGSDNYDIYVIGIPPCRPMGPGLHSRAIETVTRKYSS
jgi:Tol biopolymer transport system component